jgi:hypothetical protein
MGTPCDLGRPRNLNVLGDLVDLVGIEPTTSSMPWKRAPSCATGPHKKLCTRIQFSLTNYL